VGVTAINVNVAVFGSHSHRNQDPVIARGFPTG
jgi:hypothetical protein